MSSPRAKKVASQPPEQKTDEDLYAEYGTRDTDELILRALMPEADLKKMRENGPVARDYPLLSSPELAQVGRLMKIAKAPLVQIESQNLSVTLRK